MDTQGNATQASTRTRTTLIASTVLSLFTLGCDSESPVEDDALTYRSGSATEAASIGSGSAETCIVSDQGELRCWGLGSAEPNASSPADVEPVVLPQPALQVDVGLGHHVALTDDGVVLVWGTIPGEGNLLSFELAELPTPAGFDESAVEVVAGADFGCARMQAGTVQCWGNNAHGQLGRGDTTRIGDDESFGDGTAIDLGASALDIAAGAHHACAVLDSGLVRCWGDNGSGQLGYGHQSSIGDDEGVGTAQAIDLGHPAIAITAGAEHTCALLDSGGVRCWGSNEHGQLGYGAIPSAEIDSAVAAADVAVGAAVTDLAAGARHTCAVLVGGSLQCWGNNELGQLGRGHAFDIGDDESVADVPALDLGADRAVAVSAGPTADVTFVTLEHGQVRSWGHNAHAQLGHSDTLVTVGNGEDEYPGELPDIIIDDAHDED